MTPAVLKMETMKQKAQDQISNMVLARKMAGKEQEQQVMRIKRILKLLVVSMQSTKSWLLRYFQIHETVQFSLLLRFVSDMDSLNRQYHN